MQTLDEADSVWSVKRFSERSFDDEFGSTIESDVFLLQIAIIVVSVYTFFAISDWRDGCVGLRLSLTFGGMLAPLLPATLFSYYADCSLLAPVPQSLLPGGSIALRNGLLVFKLVLRR
jgi:hypothetical protein